MGTHYTLFRVRAPVTSPATDPTELIAFGTLDEISRRVLGGSRAAPSGSLEHDGLRVSVSFIDDPVRAISVDHAAPWDLLPVIDRLAGLAPFAVFDPQGASWLDPESLRPRDPQATEPWFAREGPRRGVRWSVRATHAYGLHAPVLIDGDRLIVHDEGRLASSAPTRPRRCGIVAPMTDPKNVVRTRGLAASDGTLLRHPLNPASEVRIQPLSDRVGLKRAALSIARVPPGKESFIAHAHSVQEEFVFILEGRGKALIGAQEVDVGPGDYIGYPTDGTPHNLRNDGDVDLVYLQGGERMPLDVTHFPTVGRTGIFDASGQVRFYDTGAAEVLPHSAWVAKE